MCLCSAFFWVCSMCAVSLVWLAFPALHQSLFVSLLLAVGSQVPRAPPLACTRFCFASACLRVCPHADHADGTRAGDLQIRILCGLQSSRATARYVCRHCRARAAHPLAGARALTSRPCNAQLS